MFPQDPDLIELRPIRRHGEYSPNIHSGCAICEIDEANRAFVPQPNASGHAFV